jgi:hypothetical protein
MNSEEYLGSGVAPSDHVVRLMFRPARSTISSAIWYEPGEVATIEGPVHIASSMDAPKFHPASAV